MLMQQQQQQQHQADEQEQQMMAIMIKGKRTKRSRTASPLAALTCISTSGDDSCRVATSSSTTTTANEGATEEEEDMANCLILLAQGASKTQKLNHDESETLGCVAPGMFVYECKTCSRCFPSFQALGGHRASHRKPKLPVTTLSLSEAHQTYFQSPEKVEEQLGLSLQMGTGCNSLSASNHKSNKVHACAICAAEFASGQALGGHMRRHRPIAPPKSAASPSPSPPKNGLTLDLNLPADDEEEHPNFIFASSQKTLVFANSLVDCRY